MKNFTYPIQTYRKSIETFLSNKKANYVDIELVPNEFYDHNDPLGLFSSESEPFSYLTTENIEKTVEYKEGLPYA